MAAYTFSLEKAAGENGEEGRRVDFSEAVAISKTSL